MGAWGVKMGDKRAQKFLYVLEIFDCNKLLKF